MISARQILEATGGSIITGDNAKPRTASQFADDIFFAGVSIDSRTIRAGELFLALKGDRFDGHDFLQNAIKLGGGAIISRDHARKVGVEGYSGILTVPGVGKSIILVDDTLAALHAIAHSIRTHFAGNVVAVAGSNGKTTTKELISSILGVRLNVLKTHGNLNNHIGMPLSIMKFQEDTDVMVLEMGTNRPGDINGLCAIASPDIGVITNIGEEHLEGFGSLASVRDSELELLSCVKKMVVNADDEFLMEGVKDRYAGPQIRFGIRESAAEITAEGIELHDRATKFTLCCGGSRVVIESGLSGLFNVYNSLAASAAAYALGFGPYDIKKGLESFNGVPMRLEIFVHDGVTYINDSYNANPSSMEESVKELVRRRYGGARAIVVLGDMLELGEYSTEAHKKLGRWLSELAVDIFIGAGPLMSLAVEVFPGKGIAVASAKDAGNELEKLVRHGDVVLVKGSRGMRMEGALERIHALRTAI
jgi:UDP-N-acetylmuramoyl-tripeptide--D-alanyl-D-alanine ligase